MSSTVPQQGLETADMARYQRAPEDGRLVIGVADLAVHDQSDTELVTYALGSCIGVTIYDPQAKVGGMLHFMLPSARQNKEKGANNPAMFGDLGVPLLFRAAYELGASKDRLIVCAAGGAEILSDDGHFKIGSRNRTVLRKLFWKNGILLTAEDTGGSQSRTMSMRLSDGRVALRSKGQETELWPT